MSSANKSVMPQFCIIFLPVVFLITSIVAAILYREAHDELDQLKLVELRLVSLYEETIRHEFQTIVSDLMTLSAHAQLRSFLDHPSEPDRRALDGEFLAFCAYRGMYDQVRYLDETGMEDIRVDCTA